MPMSAAYFTTEIARRMIKNPKYVNRVNELRNIQTSLGADTTTRSDSLQTPPAATKIDHKQTPFSNSILHVINRGKASNLSNSVMATQIGIVLAPLSPPANTVAPSITYTSGGGGAGTQPGAIYASTFGTWTGSPTYARQWLRGGANIAGATAASYTTVAADAGTNLSCRVTGTNANGSVPATSNVVAIT